MKNCKNLSPKINSLGVYYILNLIFMKPKYLIKNIWSNKYLTEYPEEWTMNISKALTYNSEEDAIFDIQENLKKELFKDKIIEVKKVYIFS
jgi:hypothetical protein